MELPLIHQADRRLPNWLRQRSSSSSRHAPALMRTSCTSACREAFTSSTTMSAMDIGRQVNSASTIFGSIRSATRRAWRTHESQPADPPGPDRRSLAGTDRRADCFCQFQTTRAGRSTTSYPTSIFEAGAGIPGMETLLPAFFTAAKAPRCRCGSNERRASVGTPARFFGIYPKKGVLQAGADADIAVFAENRRRSGIRLAPKMGCAGALMTDVGLSRRTCGAHLSGRLPRL